jgi:hypothetical protein
MHLSDSSNESFIIVDDIYKVFQISNVQNCFDNGQNWEIDIYNQQTITPKTYLFLFETGSSWSFGHWVYECGIYLPLFKKLKERYPLLKLVSNYKRFYKKLFFDIFSIDDDDIIYNTNSLEHLSDGKIYLDLPNNNICFLPSPISSLTQTPIYPFYKKQIEAFLYFFDKIDIPNTHEIEYLLMPKGIKDQAIVNVRVISFEKLFIYFKGNKIQHSILNTDNITDLKVQISFLRKSKNIILCDGSAYFVNILFCKNKTIYTVTDVVRNSAANNPRFALLINIICNINQHTTINTFNEDECIQKLESIL